MFAPKARQRAICWAPELTDEGCVLPARILSLRTSSSNCWEKNKSVHSKGKKIFMQPSAASPLLGGRRGRKNVSVLPCRAQPRVLTAPAPHQWCWDGAGVPRAPSQSSGVKGAAGP